MKLLFRLNLSLMILTLFSISYVKADETKTHVDTSHSEEMGEFKGAKNTTHPEWFKESFLDLEEDIAEATDNNKRLVLYFFQPGCPYCDQLWQDNFSEQIVVDEFRNNFDIIALNMWGDRDIVNVGGNNYSEKTFSKALGIQYTPTLLFFNENRKVIHQLNGYVPVENFRKSMEYVSGKHEKNLSFSEFSVAGKSKKNMSVESPLNTQDFFIQPSFNLDQRNKNNPEKKYTIVFFEESNCHNCDLLHQKTLSDPATLSLAKQFNAVQLDRYSETPVVTPTGESTTSEKWATELGVDYLPALIFFDEGGRQVMRIDTQLRTFHVQSIFDYVLSGAYKTETDFQRYISARADRIRDTGKEVDIFSY